MKIPFLVLFLICRVTFGFSQDSLLITNHFAVVPEIECCRNALNQLDCIDSLINSNHQINESDKKYGPEFYKKERAFVIYHINAGWINNARGNYTVGQEHFKAAEKYADSLILFTEHHGDIQEIMIQLHELQKQWCFHTYKIDSTQFYACDCAKFFPELNEERETTPPRLEAVNLYGAFYLNNTLRIDSQFTCDASSSNYFKKNQSKILSNLSKYPTSEVIREMSLTGTKYGNELDTLIFKIVLNSDKNKIAKECSIAYTNCTNFISEYYLQFLINIDLPYSKEAVSFYIPIVIQQIEPSVYYNLDQTVLAEDHYLIKYEKVPRDKNCIKPN